MIRFGRSAFAIYGGIGCLTLLVVPVAVVWGLSAEDPPTAPLTNASMIMRAADVGGEWPFRVPAIRVACGDGYAIWAEADGWAVGLTRYTYGKPESYSGTLRVGEGDELDRPGQTVGLARVARVAVERCEAAGLRA